MSHTSPTAIVLSEPAQSKCTCTYHKSQSAWKFTGIGRTRMTTSIEHRASTVISVATLFEQRLLHRKKTQTACSHDMFYEININVFAGKFKASCFPCTSLRTRLCSIMPHVSARIEKSFCFLDSIHNVHSFTSHPCTPVSHDPSGSPQLSAGLLLADP